MDQQPSSSHSSSSMPSRPVLDYSPVERRRELRAMQRKFSISEIKQHKSWVHGYWIAVDGKVYDITGHVVEHQGWESGTQVSTVLSILAHSGTDCSAEFNEIHRPYPIAFKQLQAYYIGELAPDDHQGDVMES